MDNNINNLAPNANPNALIAVPDVEQLPAVMGALARYIADTPQREMRQARRRIVLSLINEAVAELTELTDEQVQERPAVWFDTHSGTRYWVSMRIHRDTRERVLAVYRHPKGGAIKPVGLWTPLKYEANPDTGRLHLTVANGRYWATEVVLWGRDQFPLPLK